MVALLACAAALPVSPAAGLVVARSRVSAVDARGLARYTFAEYARLTDHRLVIGLCGPAGRYGRACVVRLDGPFPQRYRVLVHEAATQFLLTYTPLPVVRRGGHSTSGGTR